MSVSALPARTPAAAATASGATASHGPAAGAGTPGEGDNVFAALLAGLGEPAQPATAADDATALTAALTKDADPAAGDPALSAAAPDPLAGMALLMAQYTPGVAPAASSASLPAAISSALPSTLPSALPAGPVVAPSATTSPPALAGTDLFNTPGLERPDLAGPAATTLLPALAADAAPVQVAADPQVALPALPDMASLTAGWATAPTPPITQGPAAAAPVYQAELPSRPGEAAFAGDLAAQVTVLVEGGFQRAELRLNPSELGPIQIQLSVSAQANTADISFSAVHGLTRESIERALPELREMLQAQGLSLGQTGVSGGQQQPGDGRDSAAAQGRLARPGAAPGGDGAPADAGLHGLGGLGAAPRATRGMLDLYA
jgi:flagellar hook-length control protein FliK